MKEPKITPLFVAKALGLPPQEQKAQEPQKPFSLVTTDSRKIEPGCLFVALKGEKFDGHDFIADAVRQGARGILCREDFPLKHPEHVSVFAVKDSEDGYRQLAAAWRDEFSIPVIAVAGSNGKTTTKEFLAAILQGRWSNVLKTEGSQNGYVGIPMTLLGLRPEHGAAVVEVGIDEIGAMSKHITIVDPDAAVLTAIGPEHLEKLNNVSTVAREETIALVAVAKAGGFVALNLDDPLIRAAIDMLPESPSISYTLETKQQAPEILRGEIDATGKILHLHGAGLDGLVLPLPLLGTHNALNLLGAVAMARGLGLNADEIQNGLKTFKGATGRSELTELPGPTPVLCDYYNSSPLSVRAGLTLLTEISRKTTPPRTRWACLGDMLELGRSEEKFHRDIAVQLKALKMEHVLLYGPRMKFLLDELKIQGFSGTVEHFETHDQMAAALKAAVKKGDAILIKGSRGMKMEKVWQDFQKSFAP